MDRHGCTALRATPSFGLEFKELFDSFISYYGQVVKEACAVPCAVSFVKPFQSLTWILRAFIAEFRLCSIKQYAVYYDALLAIFRF